MGEATLMNKMMNKILREVIVLLGVGLAWLWIFPAISEAQTLNDPGLSVQQVVGGLSSPTTMAFIGPNDLLVLQKNDGQYPDCHHHRRRYGR